MSQPPDLKRLPDGVADFTAIRNPVRNYLYADKTKLLHGLLENPDKPYFLSRPRRFGKSLLVSTLGAILRGRRELFEARQDNATGRSIECLWIAGPESDYHFKPGPVINLSLASAVSASVEELKSSLRAKLNSVARDENLELKEAEPPDRFAELIQKLSIKHDRQKVAVLIDEYDAPILSEITNPELAKGIRKTLATFYATLKDCEELRGFTFITGVTKFAQASLFSDLNNLDDLTLQEGYAAICGLTVEEEFGALFGDRLRLAVDLLKAKGVLSPSQTKDDLRDLILTKYDGYSWDGRTKVLNPWSILNFFKELKFRDYWATSGSPTFLIDLITKNYVSLDCFKANNDLSYEINSVDINYFNPQIGNEKWDPTVLMFQTGYLTIKNSIDTTQESTFSLKIPNTEVKNSIIRFLIPSIGTAAAKRINTLCLIQAKTLVDSLSKLDPKGFEKAFGSLLASIPYQIHLPYEAYYHTALIFALILADQPYYAEPSTGDGRVDISLRTAAGNVHVIEIKHQKETKTKKGDKPPTAEMIDQALRAMLDEAMAQIDDRRYVLPHQGGGYPVYKTALAVYGRTRVKVEFREADNLALETMDHGQFVVMRTGD